MPHRDLNSVAVRLADFMGTDSACQHAAKSLGNGVEIGIRIADHLDCAFYRSAEGPRLEVRAAQKPDVVFHLSTTAVDVIISKKDRHIGDLGVEVLKQYLAGEVKIRVPGSLFSIMKNGYLGIIKDAGLPFARFLAENGVTNLAKIPEIIKKLREKH